MVENTLIYSFQKNVGEQVRISLTNIKGIDLLDVQVYYLDGGSGEKWKPSRKGISMKREHTKSLLEGLKLAGEKSSNEK